MKDWIGNGNSIYKTLGASNHTDKERAENDYYATDPIAIDKLLKVEKLNYNILECAAGEGHLAERLKKYGYHVTTVDIVQRNYPLDYCEDFLDFAEIYTHCDIVTNPPYKFAKEFVLKSIDHVQDGRKICMFLKLTFLEGKTRYRELFKKYPPKKIYVFSERVLCAKNGDFERLKENGGSAVAYAWFVWQKGYKGRTIVDWI